MFTGESKGRVVSSSGRKRDLSRNSVLEDSRKQREQRALDKKRMIAAVVIQKNYRRYLSRERLRKEITDLLDQQLLKISQIESLLPSFALPFETVILLMKYSVFSHAIFEDERWEKVIVRITKSFRSPNSLREWEMKLNDRAKIHSFQIVLVSFCRNFLTFMKFSNFPQIVEFLRSLIEAMSEETSNLFKNCIRGVFQLLHDQPYRFLREVLLCSQPISVELEDLSATLIQLCNFFLLGDTSSVDFAFLGSGQYSWGGFARYVLSIPNLFRKTWALKYLNQYNSPDRMNEMLHHWNSALASVSSQLFSELEIVGLAGNFFAVVSNSPIEFLQGVPTQLWKSLLTKSLQDDLLLLNALRLYHGLHTNDEGGDSISVEGSGSLATLDHRIILSQGRLSHLMQSKDEMIELVIDIVNSLLQPSFLRFWLRSISYQADSGELLEEDLDLLVLFSRLLIFTPPSLLMGNQFSARSVPSGLRTLAYMPIQILLKKIWSRLGNLISADASELQIGNRTSHFYFLLFLVYNQLLTIDDIEFTEGSKSLTMAQFTSVALTLKDLLYFHYWTQGTLDSFISGSGHSIKQLFDIQLVYLGSKVFNNLITRNERLNYCSSDFWTWSTISPTEFEVCLHEQI